MGSGRSGRYNGTRGSGAKSKNVLPKKDAQIKHIFRKSKGHLCNTPKNQKTIIDLINDESNYKGTDKDGCKWYIKKGKNGSQYWAKVFNGIVSDAGYNRSPLDWDDETGLCKNPKKQSNPFLKGASK